MAKWKTTSHAHRGLSLSIHLYGNISTQSSRFNGTVYAKIEIQDHLFTLKPIWRTMGDVLEDVQTALFYSMKVYSD